MEALMAISFFIGWILILVIAGNLVARPVETIKVGLKIIGWGCLAVLVFLLFNGVNDWNFIIWLIIVGSVLKFLIDKYYKE